MRCAAGVLWVGLPLIGEGRGAGIRRMLLCSPLAPLLSDRNTLLPSVPMLPLPRPSVRRFFSREPMCPAGAAPSAEGGYNCRLSHLLPEGRTKGRRSLRLSLYIISAGRKAIGRRCAERRFALALSCSGTAPCYLCERGAHPSNGASPFHSVGTVVCRSFFTGVWPLCSCRLPLLYIPPCWLSP